MENASKALLIAGSILIVILLIAVGMRVFNSASGTTDSVELVMSSAETAMFNNKFNQYVGERKSAKEVKALGNIIVAHNGTAKSDSKKVKLSLYDQFSGAYCDSNDPNTILRAINTISTDKVYKIQIREMRARWFN